jgi:hypothetical protein
MLLRLCDHQEANFGIPADVGRWRDDIWTMKYLSGFKWEMLGEQVGKSKRSVTEIGADGDQLTRNKLINPVCELRLRERRRSKANTFETSNWLAYWTSARRKRPPKEVESHRRTATTRQQKKGSLQVGGREEGEVQAKARRG